MLDLIRLGADNSELSSFASSLSALAMEWRMEKFSGKPSTKCYRKRLPSDWKVSDIIFGFVLCSVGGNGTTSTELLRIEI